MLWLTLGMVVFLTVHLIPTFVGLRQRLIGFRGEAFYKIGLFGGFGVFALFDMWSSNRRGAEKNTKKFPVHRDILMVTVGVIVYGVILHLHPYLFGVSAIP